MFKVNKKKNSNDTWSSVREHIFYDNSIFLFGWEFLLLFVKIKNNREDLSIPATINKDKRNVTIKKSSLIILNIMLVFSFVYLLVLPYHHSNIFYNSWKLSMVKNSYKISSKVIVFFCYSYKAEQFFLFSPWISSYFFIMWYFICVINWKDRCRWITWYFYFHRNVGVIIK